MTTAHAKTTPVTPPATTDLESRISLLESKLARALADYANLEKRFEKDSSSVVKFANANLLEKLLDVRDHLEAATSHFKDQSVGMILAELDKILVEEGVVEIKTDGVFDPTVMECHESAAGEKDKIVSVSRRGYTLAGRLLRPARVIVGNGISDSKDTKDTKVT